MQGVAIPITMVSGNSIMHRINPMPKLAWAASVLIICFATRNPAILGALFVLGVILILIAGIGKAYMRVVMILFPISLTLIVMQSIAPAFPKPWTPIVPIGPFTIYQEGIYSGITMLLRIMSMTTFALVFIMTSHPSDIFTSLQKIGMPYVLNFILTMTLQLIPILQNEFAVVLNAQKSRGMKGAGFGAILPSMVPVFVGAIERVQQLSISLESRAYGSSGNKTSYRQVSMNARDYIVLVSSGIFTAVMLYWIIVDKSLDWKSTFTLGPTWSIVVVAAATLGFLVFIFFALRTILKT